MRFSSHLFFRMLVIAYWGNQTSCSCSAVGRAATRRCAFGRRGQPRWGRPTASWGPWLSGKWGLAQDGLWFPRCPRRPSQRRSIWTPACTFSPRRTLLRLSFFSRFELIQNLLIPLIARLLWWHQCAFVRHTYPWCNPLFFYHQNARRQVLSLA